MEFPAFSVRLRSKPFPVVVEFTPRARADLDRIIQFAKAALEQDGRSKEAEPAVAALSLTQNPAGRLSFETGAAVEYLLAKGFPREIELIPHVTGKDMNVDALRVLFRSLLDAGIRTVLALTGDKPVSARGVFEVDSLGLLDLVRQTNVERLSKARNDAQFRTLPQLEAGAAVSPFKYTEGSRSMQYIKAEKKLRQGARFLVAQAGWDSARSRELIQTFRPGSVPVVGNVLVVDYPTARIMKSLPGCVVTDEFLTRLSAEDSAAALERAAQQVAMFRDLGYAACHIGNVESIEDVETILKRSAEIQDWTEFRENLDFAPAGVEAKATVAKNGARLTRWTHDAVFEDNGALHGLARTLLKPVEKSRVRQGPLYHLFRMSETLAKGALFECQLCGDCYLPEDQFVCTQSQCEKRLPNVPCGDSTLDGLCGNNEDRPCAAEVIYARAKARGEVDDLRKEIHAPRLNELRGSPSILNYFFGRSHGMDKSPLEDVPLIQIAELLHASIPSVGVAMRAMEELGEEGYTKPNRGLDVILETIEKQASLKPAFLDVNVDELSGDTPAIMRRYVRLVHEHGKGVPPCIDSSNPEVLRAGLEEWFGLGVDAIPLVNSVPFHETEKFEPVLALRRDHAFSVVGMLVNDQGPMKSAEAMHDAAGNLFESFRQRGFEAGEVFFDAVTLGLTFDSCIDAMGEFKPSHTHNSLQAIRRIMNDPKMKGVHTVLGVSNWPHGVKKRRIGHIRAFVKVAMDYGLDAAIVDVTHLYGVKPADEELVQLVEMFASLDGGEDSFMTYTETIADVREKGWM